MLPVLISLGPIQIRTYGFILVLSFLVGTFILWREGQKQGYNEDKLLDLSLTLIISGFVGSRIYYVVTNWGYYSTRMSQILQFWQGGLSLHGAIIGGVIALWWFCRKNKWPFLQVADFVTLGTMLGLIVGKLGSFLNGDDYGTVSQLPWAVSIPGVIGKRHPSPIYEAILAFLVYYFLLKKYRTKEKSGGIFYSALILLGISRLFLEFFRDNQTYILRLKEGFWGGVVLVLVGAAGLYWFYNRSANFDHFVNRLKTVTQFLNRFRKTNKKSKGV